MTKAKNFKNCIIYKLVCLDTTYPEVYVGSTTCFKQRKSDHKSKSKNDKCKEFNYKVYQYIREHGGFENFAMVEIENFSCENGRQLEAREEYWRKELKATLNGHQAFITEEEKKEYHKEYRTTHKDELLQQKKEYYETHKDEIKQKKKEYYETHKDELLKQMKVYMKVYMKEYRLRKKLEKLNLNETI